MIGVVDVPRAVLQDRWDSVMEWSRTGGNASEEYMALNEALHTLATVVIGCDQDADIDIPDDDLLFAVGELVIDAVERYAARQTPEKGKA